MTRSSIEESDAQVSVAVAPAWHTVVLLIAWLGLSLLGAIKANHLRPHHQQVPRYISGIVIEWLTVAFIYWGVKRRGIRIADLMGGSWARGVDLLRDIGIGIAFLIVGGTVVGITKHLLKAGPNQELKNLLPQGRTEMILWVLLSLTAGFCEELIFRGYLQRQFRALTRSAAAAILLQGIAFGAVHGYQGWKRMVAIAVFGAMFGSLAHWRRSTRPGMITHAAVDTIAGFVGRYRIGYK